MLIYTTKDFARLARRMGVSDEDLKEAVRRTEAGLIDGPLGALLIKQRVARPGEGRSGGYRTIVFYRSGDVAIFLHMFEKGRQSTLSAHEKRTYREFAKKLASITDDELEALVNKQGWKEIAYGQPEEDVSQRRAALASSGRRGSPRRRRNR
jgi:hypothetical protein